MADSWGRIAVAVTGWWRSLLSPLNVTGRTPSWSALVSDSPDLTRHYQLIVCVRTVLAPRVWTRKRFRAMVISALVSFFGDEEISPSPGLKTLPYLPGNERGEPRTEDPEPRGLRLILAVTLSTRAAVIQLDDAGPFLGPLPEEHPWSRLRHGSVPPADLHQTPNPHWSATPSLSTKPDYETFGDTSRDFKPVSSCHEYLLPAIGRPESCRSLSRSGTHQAVKSRMAAHVLQLRPSISPPGRIE